MNRGLKVYKDNRKRGTVKLRGKIGTNTQRNRGIQGQMNGWKEKRRHIKTEAGPEDKPSPLHSISKRRSGLMLIALDSGSRGPGSRGSGSRGPGSRGPGSRGPGSRGPGSRPGRSTCCVLGQNTLILQYLSTLNSQGSLMKCRGEVGDGGWGMGNLVMD